jgi:hypothetical protein
VAAGSRQAALAARVASARLRLSAGDVVGAMERLEAVLSEERDHAEARRELAGARGRLEAIDGRVADSARREAAEARWRRLEPGWPRATSPGPSALRGGAPEDSAHEEARQGLAEAQERRAAREAQEQEVARRAALDARAAEGRGRLDAGDPGGAIERFEAVLREDGAHEEARRGLAAARERWAALEARDAEVAAALSAVETTLGEPDLEAVEAALAWLVDLAPAPPAGRAPRPDRPASRAGRGGPRADGTEALAEAGRLLREEQLDRALGSLARVRAIAPQHPDLPKLERQAQRITAAREKQVGALLASAREALERDDLDAAQRAAQDALGIAARHPEALAVLERVQARTREVAQARRVDALAAEAGRLLEEGKLDESEALVAELGELAPKHPQLAS